MDARRTAAKWSRRWLVVAWIAVGAVGAHSESVPSYEQVSRLAHECDQAERDLARHLAERSRVTGPPAMALEAKINLRVAMHFLYHQATQAASPVRELVAARADVLQSGLPELDRLADQVAACQTALAQLPQSSGDPDVVRQRQQLQARLSGLALLASATGKDMPKTLAGAKDLTAFVNRLAKALLLMAAPERVGKDRLDLPPAWPEGPTPATSTTEPHRERPLDPDRLTVKIEQSSLSVASRRQMLDLLERVRGGLREPERRDEVLELGRVIDRNFQAAQTMAQTRLVSEPVKLRLEEHLQHGLALFSDPRSRPMGLKRLEEFHRAAEVIMRLEKVRLSEESRRHLAASLHAAIGYLDRTAQHDSGVRMLTHLDRLTEQILHLKRTYDDVTVPKPFDQPFQKVRDRYARCVDVAAAELAKENWAAMETQITRMQECAAQLDLIRALPEVLAEMRRWSPFRSGALQRQFAAVAQDLAAQGQEQRRAVAFANAAVEAQRLIDRFGKLAYDRRHVEGMDKALGGRLNHLRRIGEGAQADLVAGFAATSQDAALPVWTEGSGKAGDLSKASEARRTLEHLVTILSAAQLLAKLDGLGTELIKLERWRAWCLPVTVLRPMLHRFSSSVTAVSAQWTDKTADMAAAIEPVRRHLPLVEILVAVGERYGGRLDQAPQGVLGIVARLYDDPDHPVTPSEQTAMRMSLEIREAVYTEQLGWPAYTARHLEQARRLLDSALDQGP